MRRCSVRLQLQFHDPAALGHAHILVKTPSGPIEGPDAQLQGHCAALSCFLACRVEKEPADALFSIYFIDANIFDKRHNARLQKGIVRRSLYRHCAKANDPTGILRDERKDVLSLKQAVKFCFRKRVDIAVDIGPVFDMQTMYLPDDAVHSWKIVLG